MSNWKEHNITKYPDYFKTEWWISLKEDHLFKRNAKCYVCGKWSKLLLHHLSYKNLFKEKLYKDIVILCFDCHTQVHFWTIFKIKVPLKTPWLIYSMMLRKTIFCTHTHRFGLAGLYFIATTLYGLFHLCLWTTKRLIYVLFVVTSIFIRQLLIAISGLAKSF